MKKENLPNAVLEKERYDKHKNTGHDYEKYIESVVKKWEAFLPEEKSSHLDYGCGPNPYLSEYLNKSGYSSEYYDSFYYPMPISDKKYDLITMIESAEHFHNPRSEFETIKNILKPAGRLIVVTHLYDGQDIANWWYAKDFTHSFFYSRSSAAYIKEMLSKDSIYMNPKGFAIYG